MFLKFMALRTGTLLWLAAGLVALSIVGGGLLLAFGYFIGGALLLALAVAERIAFTYFLDKQLSTIPQGEDLNKLIQDSMNMLDSMGIDLTALIGGKK